PRFSMRSTELSALGVREAAAAIRAGALSPVELVDACLARIRALDGGLKAWAHVDERGARATAREREAEAREGRLRGPLHGVPVGVKDIFDVAGLPTTGGARPFAHTRPSVDATAVTRLRAAGAIVLGKAVTKDLEPTVVGAPRLALAPELLGRASREVAAHVEAVADACARAGATVSKVELPATFRGLHAAGLTVLEAEAAAYHAPSFAKHADDYGSEM